MKIFVRSFAIPYVLLLLFILGVKDKNNIYDCIPDQNEIFYDQKIIKTFEKKYHQYIDIFENVSLEEFDGYIEASISDGFDKIAIESEDEDAFRFKSYKKDQKEYIYLIYEKDKKKMHRIYCRVV